MGNHQVINYGQGDVKVNSNKIYKIQITIHSINDHSGYIIYGAYRSFALLKTHPQFLSICNTLKFGHSCTAILYYKQYNFTNTQYYLLSIRDADVVSVSGKI